MFCYSISNPVTIVLSCQVNPSRRLVLIIPEETWERTSPGILNSTPRMTLKPTTEIDIP